MGRPSAPLHEPRKSLVQVAAASSLPLSGLHWLQVWAQDELDTARDRGDAAAVAALLQRREGDAQDLFERAIRLAAASCGSAAGAGQAAAAGEQPATAVARQQADSAGTGAANGSAAAQQQQQQQQQADGDGCQAAAGNGVPQPDNGSGMPAAAAENGGASSSEGSSSSVGKQWYVISYIAAFLARRAEFLASCADAGLAADVPEAQQGQPQQADGQQQRQEEEQGEHPYWRQAVATYAEALQWAGRGGAVLAQYRFQPATGASWLPEELGWVWQGIMLAMPLHFACPLPVFKGSKWSQKPPARPSLCCADEQLFKDVEGVLEEVCRDGLTALAKRQPGGQLDHSHAPLLRSLLLLWDGVCQLFAGKAKPQAWVALLLRLAKLFTPDARAAAAEQAAPLLASGPMMRVQPMWRELKPEATIRQLFESADVEGGSSAAGGGPGERAAKRRRG